MILILIICSCENKNIDIKLDNAEDLINSNPDSALFILTSLSVSDISAESQKARYILLNTHAKFMSNGGLSINDSTINIAVDFYRQNGTNKDRTLSLLYQSNYYINTGNIDKAMLNLTEIEDLLVKYDDNYAKGLYYLHLGALYQTYYDTNRAINAYQQAQLYFEKADNSVTFLLLTKFFEGTLLFRAQEQYDRAIKLITEAKEGFSKQNQENLASLCKCYLTIMYIHTNDINNATICAEEISDTQIIPNNLHVTLYSALAYLYHLENDKPKSKKYFDMAHKHAQSRNDSIQLYNLNTRLAIDNEDYKTAYEYNQLAKKLSDENLSNLLESPLTIPQLNYVKKELANNKIIQKYERQRNIAILSTLFILTISIILYFVVLNQKKKKRLDEFAGIIEELHTTIQDNKSAAADLIQTLYKDQFKMLNSISDSFFIHDNDTKGQKHIYNEIKHFIEQFSKDKKVFQNLENTVNKCCNNVMKKLREDMTDFDELDYRQLCYHYAGFSGKLISILLEKTQANIYMRKSRLKEKIQQSNCQNKDIILRHLT